MVNYEKMWNLIYQKNFEDACKTCTALLLSVQRDTIYFVYLFCLLRIISVDRNSNLTDDEKHKEKENVSEFLSNQIRLSSAGKRNNTLSICRLITYHRAPMLLENLKNCQILLIEMLFWQDDFKVATENPDFREKIQSFINHDLDFLEVVKTDLTGARSDVLLVLMGSAFETAILEYKSHDYVIERCFGILAHGLSQSSDIDVAILSKYLIHKIAYQVLKNTLNSCTLDAGSESNYYSQFGNEMFYYTVEDYLNHSETRLSRTSICSRETLTEFDVKKLMKQLHESLNGFKLNLTAMKEPNATYIGKVYQMTKNLIVEIETDKLIGQ